MSIGPDIKDVLREVGVSYTILRDSGNITGEYTFTKSNAQVTKPFIREFFLEGFVSYDTAIQVGDIVQMNTSGKKYMIMNKTPELLEDTVYRYMIVMYLCNVVADILRPTDIEATANNRWQSGIEWNYVASQINCLITTPLYGHELSVDDQIGALGIEVFEMYASTSIGIQALDRVYISATEYYQVETVKSRRFEAVDVFELGEDTRGVGMTTTSTTTTTTTSTTTTTA